MSDLWDRVLEHLERDGFMAGVERTEERIRSTAEVFTPAVLVVEMLREIPEAQWAPGAKVLDPACGDGQFLVGVKLARMFRHDIAPTDATEGLYGVDLMRDNVDICKRRLGGGVVVMGDALRPGDRLLGQTAEEHRIMLSLFGPAQMDLFSEGERSFVETLPAGP